MFLCLLNWFFIVERFRGDINDDGTPYDSAAQDFYPGCNLFSFYWFLKFFYLDFEEIRREGARVWTSTEKARAERAFMLYGFGAWEQLSGMHRYRSLPLITSFGFL